MKVKIIVQTPINTTDNESIVSQSWGDIITLNGIILPYGNDLALKEYGYKETVKYRFFYKHSKHPSLVVGNRIKYGDLFLPIVYVADYGKAQDVLLDTSGEGKG